MSRRKALSASTVIAFLVILVVGFASGYMLSGFTSQGRVVTTTVTIQAGGVTTEPQELRGEIVIDGSSTVYPITEAIAEAFMEKFPEVSVTVGISGTGGGFKRFTIGESDINDASRRIEEPEIKLAQENGVEWIEVPIAIDGLTVVVNKDNDWVDCFTVEELKAIWEPGSKVKKWSDVRPDWPDADIKLYGPGPDSGTFDFFTAKIVGQEKASRTDYVASEDDNVLVAGVEAEKYSLGYFGYAYYVENKERIRAVPINAGEGCVEPTDKTIKSFQYPLARPLFIYINKEHFEQKPHLRMFVYFYLENANAFVKQVGYTPFSELYYRRALALIKEDVYERLLDIALIP